MQAPSPRRTWTPWTLRAAGIAALGATLLLQPSPAHAAPSTLHVAATEPTATRAELQALLTRMNEAVAAADPGRYLACVALQDPCFATEQRNWAKDLTIKAPGSFEATIGEDDPVTQEKDGAAIATLTMAWTMPGAAKRTVSFPARFVRADSGWLYAGERWNVLEGSLVRVLYESEDLKDVAATVAEILPEIREHVHEGFGLAADTDLIGRTQQIKLYTSMRHLQHSIYLSYTDGLGGWNEPGEAIKILARPSTGKGTLRTLLAHEYGHVASFQFGPHATDMPWWILEGAAELAAEKYSRGGASTDRRVLQWSKNGGLLEWHQLADFRGEAASHYAHVYAQGHQMIRYISGEFGRDERNAWMREMAGGQSIDEATRKVMGMSFEELDSRWRESLKQAAAAEASKEPPAKEDPAAAPDSKPEGKPDR